LKREKIQERRSVGTQISWGVRFFKLEEVKKFLFDLAAEVSKRMEQINVSGSRVTLKVCFLFFSSNRKIIKFRHFSFSSFFHQILKHDPSILQESSGANGEKEEIRTESRKYMNPGPFTPISRSSRIGIATSDPQIIGTEAFKVRKAKNNSIEE